MINSDQPCGPFQAGETIVPHGDCLTQEAAKASRRERLAALHAATVMRRHTDRMVDLVARGERKKAKQIEHGLLGFLRSRNFPPALLAWASALLHEFDCVPEPDDPDFEGTVQ